MSCPMVTTISTHLFLLGGFRSPRVRGEGFQVHVSGQLSQLFCELFRRQTGECFAPNGGGNRDHHSTPSSGNFVDQGICREVPSELFDSRCPHANGSFGDRQ